MDQYSGVLIDYNSPFVKNSSRGARNLNQIKFKGEKGRKSGWKKSKYKQ